MLNLRSQRPVVRLHHHVLLYLYTAHQPVACWRQQGVNGACCAGSVVAASSAVIRRRSESGTPALSSKLAALESDSSMRMHDTACTSTYSFRQLALVSGGHCLQQQLSLKRLYVLGYKQSLSNIAKHHQGHSTHAGDISLQIYPGCMARCQHTSPHRRQSAHSERAPLLARSVSPNSCAL